MADISSIKIPNGNVYNFKDSLARKYTKSLFTPETVSGSVVHIDLTEDGFGANPYLDSLKVNIDPVQNLNGYGHPWPGGAGKNKLKPLYYQFSATQLVVGTNTSDMDVHVLSEGTYILSASLNVSAKWYVKKLGDSAYHTVGETSLTPSGTLTVPAGGGTYRLWLYASAGITEANVNWVQLEAGATATEYQPYENSCPISGWTEAKLMRTGKNLLPDFKYGDQVIDGVSYTKKQDGTYACVGTITGTHGCYFLWSTYELYKPGTYAMSCSSGVSESGIRFVCSYYENSSSAVKYVEITSPGQRKTFTIENGGYIQALYLRGQTTGTAVDVTVDPLLLFAEDTVQSYETPQGKNYSLTFPSEVGTVYGGYLTNNGNGTWELTVDRAMYTLTSSLSWSVATGSGFIQFFATLSDMKNSLTAISNKFQPMQLSERPTKTGMVQYNDSIIRFSLTTADSSAMGISNLGEWQTWINNNNVQIVYDLATPLTYTLTGPEVQLLLGENNIWADCGDVEVSYSSAISDQASQQNIRMLTDSNSASGDIVTLDLKDHGLTAKPQITKLSIPIEPKQDMNGYDRPWPGGAGANILNADGLQKENVFTKVAENQYTFQKTGTTAAERITTYTAIQLKSGVTYTLSFDYTGTVTSDNTLSLAYATDSETPSGLLINMANGKAYRTFTPSADYTKLRMYWANSTAGVGDSITVTNLQVTADSSVVDWTPYENLCPISGWDSLSVANSGSRMFPPFGGHLVSTNKGITVTFDYEHVTITGTSTSTNTISSNMPLAHPFLMKAGKTYIFAIEGTWSTPNLRLFLRGNDNANLFYVDSYNGIWHVIPTEDTVVYRVAFRVTANNATFNMSGAFYCTLNGPQEAEPYGGSNYDISFASSGTVYGGKLVYENGKWALTVDHGIVDLSTLEWVVYGSTFPGLFYSDSMLTDIGPTANTTVHGICSKYLVVENIGHNGSYGNSAEQPNGTIRFRNTDGRIYLRDVACETLEDLTSALTNVKMVYELANPQTYTLEGSDIKTVCGLNHFWSDADHIDLEYRIDTTSDYVDPLIGFLKSIIADNLDNYVAADNYAVGKFLVICNRFYKVTAVVSSGQSLVPGTNITETTIGDQLTALFASI